MPLIEWDESFSVHNAELDTQHKKWIAIINKMHESMLVDDYNTFMENLEGSFREMEDYTGYHFAFEEEYMLSIHYPGLAEHERKHREFRDYVAEGFRDMRSGYMLLKSNFLKITRNWLVDHIMIEDKKYSLYARERETPKEGNGLPPV